MDEPIDVVRIRLRTRGNVQAVVSEFRRADQVLATWAAQLDCGPVEFEILFFDGYVIQGHHAFFGKGRSRCSLTVYIRRLLRSAMPAAQERFPDSLRHQPRYLVSA
jgi:hypothetical protein